MNLCKQNLEFIRSEVSKNDAKSYFKDKGDNLKLDLIDDLKDGEISFYNQGNFTDLCKGPHIPSSGKIKRSIIPLKYDF